MVSQVSFPVLGGAVSLGTGAVITTAGYEDTVCPRGPARAACIKAALATTNGGGMLVRVVPGPQGRAAINHYLDAYRSTTALAITPTSLINFGEAVNFPLIFGAMLAVVGAATLAHLLVVSVARRRREIGLLKVLGFVNRQVASAVAWQATTLALIGIVIGVPLGVVAGRGDVEGVRQQPRRRPGLRRADLARGQRWRWASSWSRTSSPSARRWWRPGRSRRALLQAPQRNPV